MADLAAIVADNPAVVSAGVLARPAVQDAILGTSLQLLGPGELSYMTQAAALYPVLEVAPPAVALRPQLLVVESRHVEQLAETRDLRWRSCSATAPASIAGWPTATAPTPSAPEAARAVASRRCSTRWPGRRWRPTPTSSGRGRRPASRSSGALDRFADKLAAAAARADEVRTGRVERLRATLLPGGRPQERVVSTAHFPGKYGEGFVEAVWEQMELDGGTLQVVTP